MTVLTTTPPTTTVPATFAAQWAAAVRDRSDASFLIFKRLDGSALSWTYAEADQMVARIATELRPLGVDCDHGVHLAVENSPAFVFVWLAAIRLGSFVVPSDPAATAPELAEHITRTRPAVSFVGKDRRRVAAEAVGQLDASVPTPRVIDVDEDDGTVGLAGRDGWGPAPTAADGSPAPQLGSPDAPWPDPALTDRAAVMFTSGTTGRPKGVEITQANYAFAGTTMAAAAELGPDDRQYVVLPMFHANAQYYSFASAIAVGASVALMRRFSASGFVADAARYGVTHASLFAGPIRMILARGAPHEATDEHPRLALRHCWFAQNLTAAQYETISDWLGCRPRQLYGMTETIPAVLTDDAASVDAVVSAHEVMGRVTPGCEVDLHDADGQSVPDGDVGEVVVRGDRGTTLFAGYLDDPTTTQRSFRRGWFLTGDRAVRRSDGRFVFDGRRSDVLKVSGENVSVVEVEMVVSEHPDVFDVVVVGAPDPIRDEVPVAFVVATPDTAPGLPERLTEWCEARLSKAKRPRDYSLVEEMPRTSVGKVRKFLLAEAASAGPESSSSTTTTHSDTPLDDTEPNS